MKGLITWFTITLLNVNFGWLPKPDLLIIMGIAIIIDFITGIIKSVILGVARTSKGLQRTVIKFSQYGISVIIGMGISYLGMRVEEYNKSWEGVAEKMSWFNNGLLLFIIFIETVSILENLYALNSKSMFAKYAIKPALRILTIQIKDNPLTRVTVETEDETIKKEDVVATVKIKKQDEQE